MSRERDLQLGEIDPVERRDLRRQRDERSETAHVPVERVVHRVAVSGEGERAGELARHVPLGRHRELHRRHRAVDRRREREVIIRRSAPGGRQLRGAQVHGELLAERRAS